MLSDSLAPWKASFWCGNRGVGGGVGFWLWKWPFLSARNLSRGMDSSEDIYWYEQYKPIWRYIHFILTEFRGNPGLCLHSKANSYSKQNIPGVTSGTTLTAASTAVAQAQSIQIMITNSRGYEICWWVVVVQCSSLPWNYSDQTTWLTAWGQDSSLKLSSSTASSQSAPEHTQHTQGGQWASLLLRMG